jgi:sugar lactone lactonase YvrE
MSEAGKITAIRPEAAIPGGEITIECEGFRLDSGGLNACVIGGQSAWITAASSQRVIAVVPETLGGPAEVYLESGGKHSDSHEIVVGKRIGEDLHIVANPAVDPKDDSIIMTRSGSRGQQVEFSMFRLERDGFVERMATEIMNPTGLAFDGRGELFVTNRSDGQVCRIGSDDEAAVFATNLGIATGIALGPDGRLYVGDRSGTIYRLTEMGTAETFAVLEPSVSAYHLAFGPDGRLYVTAPGLASHDAVHVIDEEGFDEVFFRGFGRPQGLAFDTDGNLYVAACYKGRHGIVKITPGGGSAETFLAGMNIVGLCFTRRGEMVVATNDSVYSVPAGIYGTLLTE